MKKLKPTKDSPPPTPTLPKTLEQVKNTVPVENRKYKQVHCRLVYTYVLM